MIIIGQDTFLSDFDLEKYSNLKFGLNIFDWLSPTVVPPTDNDNDNDGYPHPYDCNDNDASIYPGAIELCDGKDNDCNGVVDDDFDRDGDGCTTCGGDCNDNDASIYPGAIELCDGKDNDCDGAVDEDFDKDGDGYTTCGGDCNDNDASVYPGATELDDGKDNDCDGLTDEGLAEDKDHDGYSLPSDCDDNDASVHPGATELCDKKDNDCDGTVDDDFDRDGDGYTTCGGDYNDNDASIHPGAIELCDRKDNDCDGLIDEDFDKDGDGYTTCGGDYNDNDASIYPGAIELCDRKDNDCDGLIDEDFDKDGDGYTTCGGDCNDNDVNVYPGATEQDDGKDNNCNGLIDENHSEPAALFDVSPETFQRSFLVMGGVLAFVFLIFFLRRMIKHNVPEFPKTPSRDNTEDLVILSLEKRTETEYRASLESLHRTIYPVGSTRPIEISPKVRSEIISRIEYTARLVTNYSNPERSVSLEKPAEELKKMGTVIYKNFVPRDFATKLVHHYLVLEVEDVRIPWELMYSDEFFALKYAISRRIKSDKTSEIQKSKRIKKKALIIADPTGTTPEAITECDYLKKILEHYFSVTYLRAEKAGKVDVMYHLSQGYDIIHYAGELKGESCLPVYGDVLSCGEIEKNLEGSPVIFINGCGSAKTFSYDIEGLAKVFLQKGALSFIGSLWRIHDRKAAEIAADFYRNCLYYSVGESLRLSRKKNYSSEDVTWAAFVMYGDPTLDLHGRNQFR
ncbi:MAG: CHAT domain-containing protein [Theionarchaea archaeon]|nr:CHAT domain-containing protein [Theionarchaea archaeon]